MVSLSYDLEITKGVNPHGVRPPVFVHIVDQVLLGERVDAAVGQRQLHLKMTQCQLFFFKLCIFCDLVNQRDGIFRVWLIPEEVRGDIVEDMGSEMDEAQRMEQLMHGRQEAVGKTRRVHVKGLLPTFNRLVL